MDEHPLITLLLKRMESHPNEFLDPPLRWQTIFTDARVHARSEDSEKLQRALSDLCMNRLHEQAMDELLNGDDRRAEERERREKADALMRVQALQSAQLPLGTLLGQAVQLPNAANQLTGLSDLYSQANANAYSHGSQFIDRYLQERIEDLEARRTMQPVKIEPARKSRNRLLRNLFPDT